MGDQRVANLALRAERVMPMITTMTMMTTMMITVAMVDMATLEDTMVPVMDQDTTLEATTEADTVMMIGVTQDMGMVMTTGDTQVLTGLGRADQDTGLLVTHGPRMFHVLLVLQESQARPMVARPRVARQHKVKIRPQQRR